MGSGLEDLNFQIIFKSSSPDPTLRLSHGFCPPFMFAAIKDLTPVQCYRVKPTHFTFVKNVCIDTPPSHLIT